MYDRHKRVAIDLQLATPPHEQDAPMGASGGAAPLTYVNAPHRANAGLPWLNRRRERVWDGRIERMPGAE